MTWAEALDRYGTDKPDLRFAMTLQDLSDAFAATQVKAFAAPTVKALRVAGRRGHVAGAPRRADRAGQVPRGQGPRVVPCHRPTGSTRPSRGS